MATRSNPSFRSRPAGLLGIGQSLEPALGPLAHAADRTLRAAELRRHLLSRVAQQDLLDDGPVIRRHGLEQRRDGVGEDRRLDRGRGPIEKIRQVVISVRPGDLAIDVAPGRAEMPDADRRIYAA